MNINYTNRDEINRLYLHDSIFCGFTYDYEKRQIEFSCKGFELKKRENLQSETDDTDMLPRIYNFQFNNIVLCDMQSCVFWGKSSRIYGVWVEEQSPKFDELMEIQKANAENYQGSYLDKEIKYFAFILQMISGDILTIVCESVDVD